MRSLQERFEEKYVPVTESGCWIWIGAMYGNGRYGVFRGLNGNVAAHRTSFEIYKDTSVPESMCVCHKCDVSLCVNPDHLFLATQKENVHDMIKKGRKNVGDAGNHGNHASGEKSGACKFSDEKVKQVRSDFNNGVTNKAELARRYGVSESHVRRLVLKQTRIVKV